MKILITGGSGFLGALLARRILGLESVSIAGGNSEPVTDLVLADLVAPPADLAGDPRVTSMIGDVAETVATVGEMDAVFHLAGVVSAAAEADFDLGLRVNVDGLRHVLETLRGWKTRPVLVFTSSLAVFGADPAFGAIGPVDDHTLPRPQSSYGIQKFIGEQLVADYTRKGFVRGRSVRLMTVAVRPGRPNAAASSFVSGIIREPLAGQRSNCPVPADTPIALSSPERTLEALLVAASATDGDWGSTTAMNLPALSTTPERMLDALVRITGEPLRDLVDFRPDPAIANIVSSWPAQFDTARARRLGLTADPDFGSIVEMFMSER